MKKLRMHLDDLRVESFATEHDVMSHEGTVFGQQEAFRPKPNTFNAAACNATANSCIVSCHGADCSLESCVISCPGGGTCHAICDLSRIVCPGPTIGGCVTRPD